MPDPVPPERGGLSPETDVTPRPHSHLVADIMEARDCSKPDAESFIDCEGAEQAERVVRSRWIDDYEPPGGRERHQTGGNA